MLCPVVRSNLPVTDGRRSSATTDQAIPEYIGDRSNSPQHLASHLGSSPGSCPVKKYLQETKNNLKQPNSSVRQRHEDMQSSSFFPKTVRMDKKDSRHRRLPSRPGSRLLQTECKAEFLGKVKSGKSQKPDKPRWGRARVWPMISSNHRENQQKWEGDLGKA